MTAVTAPETTEAQARLTAGRALFRVGRYAEAAAEIHAASPPVGKHAVIAVMNDAASLRRREDLPLLLAELRRLAPQDSRLLDALGMALLHLGRTAEAESALRESLARRPGDLDATNLLAMVMTESGRFEEALALMRDLRARFPESWGPGCNMACILNNVGRMEEAANVYRETIRLAPREPVLRLNHSIAMLKSGRLAQGWAEHEWRLSLPGHTSLPVSRILPNITPELDLRGKRVLVTQEEGLGDTLMYLRYVPALGRTGAIVHIWGTQTLARLCERVEGVAEVQHGGETPPYDYHCPFISLPRAFSGMADAMGAPVPYLFADPVKAARWRDILSVDRRLRVGLVWAGAFRPEDTSAMMVDRHRSMPLSTLAPLADLAGVTFYSLQKDAPAAQIPDFPCPMADFMPQCLDMDDTASLVANLDVIVSVDTSMVHLAGGMGKPVIMMDRLNNCWRWFHGREDSPWYPDLRIVRQTRFDDWSDVVTRVRALLEGAARIGRDGERLRAFVRAGG